MPHGLATPGHRLYTAREGDHRVGMLWFAERPDGAGRVAQIFDIKINPELRGNGYGNNTVARSLYHQLGYIETNVDMAKQR